MQPQDSMMEEAFHVQEPASVTSDLEQIKKILDAKYEAVELPSVVAEITYLGPSKKD